MRYRPEIDGLRAIAVLAVLLDHAKLSFFSGGFVGVDIFFVISGFLITFITIVDIEKKRFTVRRFYERRVRRIIPALVAVCSVTTVAAFLLLHPDAVRHYMESVIATLLFVANVFFYFESDYFAPSADLELMLHTWSLGVEEQFYIFFPLLFVFFYARGRALFLIATMFILSLMLAVSAGDSDAVFYLLPYRAWEFAVGAALAVYRFRSSGVTCRPALVEALALAGLALMAIAIVIAPDAPSPLYLVLPVSGAGLVILVGETSGLCKRLLANPVAVYIGRVSYSLYLWHQPVYAIARERVIGEMDFVDYVPLIVLVFILSHLSYKFVETPLRNRQKFVISKLFVSIAGLTLPVLLIGPFLLVGVTRTASAYDENLGRYVNYRIEQDRSATWIAMREPLTHDKRLRIAVVGNSHAKDMVNALRYSPLGEKFEFVPLIANAECRLSRRDKLLSLLLPRREARDEVAQCTSQYPFLEAMADELSGVVIAPLWYDDLVEDLPGVLDRLNEMKLPVLVVGNTARFDNVPQMTRNLVMSGVSDIAELNRRMSRTRRDESEVNDTVETIAKEHKSTYLDRGAIVCPESVCDLTFGYGEFALFDSGHWTLGGANRYASRIHESAATQAFIQEAMNHPAALN